MSAGEEPRRRKGRLLAMMPVAVFALIGAGFYWGLFNGDDTLASPLIGKAVPEFDLHLIVDNYATHKHPKVRAWLKRHPRFHVHFTPTSSSWLNVIERWFRS